MEPESSPARATTSPWLRTSTTWKRRLQIVRTGGVTQSVISIDHGALVVADDRGVVEVVELDSGTRPILFPP